MPPTLVALAAQRLLVQEPGDLDRHGDAALPRFYGHGAALQCHLGASHHGAGCAVADLPFNDLARLAQRSTSQVGVKLCCSARIGPRYGACRILGRGGVRNHRGQSGDADIVIARIDDGRDDVFGALS